MRNTYSPEFKAKVVREVLKLIFWQDATWFGGMLIGGVVLLVYRAARLRD